MRYALHKTKHTHFKSTVLDVFWTNACTCFTTAGLLLLLLLLHCSIQIENTSIVLKSFFMIQSLTLKEMLKTIFFFLFSSIDLPQHTCVSFSFLSIIATLAVCQFVGFKQGGAYWLYWLGRGEYALLFFYFVLSELSHTLWNPHACIHSSIPPPPPTFHWSLPHTPSYPSIQLFVECLPWVMGHQESHPHLIYVLLGKPDSLPTTLRRSYISDGEV